MKRLNADARPERSPGFALSSMIAAIVLAVSTLLTVAVAWHVKTESRDAAIASAHVLFDEIAAKTLSRILVLMESISTLAETAAASHDAGDAADDPGLAAANLQVMRTLLDNNDQLMSAYVGYENGAFFQLLATRGDDRVAKTYGAPAGTSYIDRRIVAAGDGSRRQTWRFLGPDLSVLATRTEDRAAYDPRERPWYREAVRAGGVILPPRMSSAARGCPASPAPVPWREEASSGRTSP